MAKAGIATIALRRYDLQHALELAAEAGYDGVEIWGRSPHTPEDFDRSYWQKVRDKLRELGLEVSMFGSYVNPASPDCEEKLSVALAASGLIGARIVRVWAGNAEPQSASEEMWRSVAGAYVDICNLAEDQGITLAIEMHAGTLSVSPEGALRMLEEVGAPNLKLNYQIGDPARLDIEHDIALVGPHVVNIHAQNFLPPKEEGGRYELSLIEEGVVDYRRLLELLEPYGFDGYIEVEFLKGESAGEEALLDSLKKDAEYLRSVLRA